MKQPNDITAASVTSGGGISKEQSGMLHGFAALCLLCDHLFNRLADLPYTPLVIFGRTPLCYVFGLLGDMCVPIFSLIAGYAQMLLCSKAATGRDYLKGSHRRLLRLLTRYWVILCLFSLLGLLTPTAGECPASLKEFVLHVFLLTTSYNGAWWYLNSYLLLVLTFPLLHRVYKKWPPVAVIGVTGILFCAGYYFSNMNVTALTTGLTVPDWIIREIRHYAECLFPFSIGALLYRCETIPKWRRALAGKWFRIPLLIAVPLLFGAGHLFVRSVALGTVNGIVFSVLFCLIDMPRPVGRVLSYVGRHSTNIWLIHVFFYVRVFKDLVFIAKYPILIFFFMLALCLVSSYTVDGILKLIDRVGSLFRKKPAVPDKSA